MEGFWAVEYPGGRDPMLRGPYYIPHEKWKHPWAPDLCAAKEFRTKEEAEAAAFAFAAKNPDYIGELVVVPVARRKAPYGTFLEKIYDAAPAIH